MNPPSGLEPTPARGFPYLNCPHCGGALPRLAFPVHERAAQETTTPARAVELEDATPTQPQPVDRRLADTERIEISD